ncbi:coiled-coil domain-containing protein 134 isoform X3 [Lynx canadensis]|uniref:coiled-coil domain-containing protein 134 isoform X3 n=1 Tax=Lynx canadensis TaxID=61383 RepID=UPI0013C3F126|nr:coiled-coil domain-containing protein 134 isoform X3 [Lynx canadensis]
MRLVGRTRSLLREPHKGRGSKPGPRARVAVSKPATATPSLQNVFRVAYPTWKRSGNVRCEEQDREAGSRILDMDLLQFLAFVFVMLLSGTGVTGTLRTSLDPSLEIYKKMFEVKRREQLLALKNLAQLNDVHQQYKILDVMLKGLFKVLEDSRTVLIAADVLPDGPFPQDEKLKDDGPGAGDQRERL